jgi:hypothetical protein
MEEPIEITKETISELEDTLKHNILKNIESYLGKQKPQCDTPADVLRARTESLGDEYTR